MSYTRWKGTTPLASRATHGVVTTAAQNLNTGAGVASRHALTRFTCCDEDQEDRALFSMDEYVHPRRILPRLVSRYSRQDIRNRPACALQAEGPTSRTLPLLTASPVALLLDRKSDHEASVKRCTSSPPAATVHAQHSGTRTPGGCNSSSAPDAVGSTHALLLPLSSFAQAQPCPLPCARAVEARERTNASVTYSGAPPECPAPSWAHSRPQTRPKDNYVLAAGWEKRS
ncbi:hypothetical protein GY45DRAFT_781620 [Cubamyces sp. BRFM 1775]|nr:hypothetical protein GY45DRAFT_781620 [Cubamyces sp. BRFM 1775]